MPCFLSCVWVVWMGEDMSVIFSFTGILPRTTAVSFKIFLSHTF